MLNRLLLSLVQKNTQQASAMRADDYENPASYRGWIYPLRFMLALRYLKHKQHILAWFRQQKTYPIKDEAYHQKLIEQLSGKPSVPYPTSTRKPFYSISFKAGLIYPLLLAGLLLASYTLFQWYQQKRVENVLANHLPYFSDLLHRKLIFKHNGVESALQKVNQQIEQEEKTILKNLPEKEGIRALMAEQLTKLKDTAVDSEAIMLGFKAVNTLFDQKGLPFYLTPKSFSMPCSSFIDAPVEQMMMIKKMEELLSGNNPERCRTTMMTAYKVDQRDALFLDNKSSSTTELPLFQVRRIDKVPAVDSALGLTFKERGIGSIILRDRIRNFSNESILPALTFQGRSYIIPFWMQGYYEIEEAITKAYQKDLYDIYPSKTERIKVKTAIKKLIKNKQRMNQSKLQQTLEQASSVNEKNIFGNGLDAISGFINKDKSNKSKKIATHITDEEQQLLQRLDAVLLPSIEYHEAYHQIDKTGWTTPFWVKGTFKDELSANGLDHTLEELGAYLSQLSKTDQGQNIWLGKLLLFSLNPMTKGQAEYYASSIILNTMQGLYLGKPLDVTYKASVDEKTLIYKTLTTKSKREIQDLAKRAYETLFEREVPELHK